MTRPEQEAREMLAPLIPTEEMWGGLARQIIMWMDMCPKTPRALFQHLECSGHEIPQWLRDEPEMKHLDHVPSKGTRAVIVYRAMIEPLKAFAARPTAGIDREVVRKLLDNLRYKLGHVQIARQNGDNLAVALCSHFEDDSYDCEEEEDENGWTPSASAGCDEMLAAIHALYADAILALLPTPAKTGERGAWRPISTAPKDGSRMLVTNDRGIFAAEFDADWGDGGWWMVSDGKDFERPLRGDTPTHWQPLPDAPIVGGEEIKL